MHTVIRSLIYLSFLFGIFPAAATTTVGGIEVPASYTMDGVKLPLNGAGVRSKLFLKIYVGALYLQTTTHDAETALSGKGAGSMQMFVLYNHLSAEKITQSWQDGVNANLDADRRNRIAERLKKFNSWFTDLNKNDRVYVDYLPGKGTRLTVNSTHLGTIEGDDFFPALLSAWLGERPADPQLKRGLLGG